MDRQIHMVQIRVARWRCGRTLGFGPTGGRWPAGSITGRPVTKVGLPLIHRLAAVGKLFTLIALAGEVAVHEGYGSRSTWRRLVNLEWLPYMSVS